MSVRITIDRAADVLKSLKTVGRDRVLVGIPSDDEQHEGQPPDGHNERKGDPGGITNAALGYIHEHGAPEANIPARPFLIPAAKSIKNNAAKRLRDGASKALDGDSAAMDKALNAVGLLGQAAVRRKLTQGPFEPIAPATALARIRRQKSRAAKYAGLSDEDKSEMIEGTIATAKPLIDTGQLRASIAYVIRRKGG